MAGRRRSDRSLRNKLHSPGRPPVARPEHRRRFWALIAGGQSSEDAAIDAGVSAPVGAHGFGRQAACHHRRLRHHRSLCLGNTCRLRSGRSLRSSMPRAPGCERSPARWGGQDRQSRESCAVTLARAAASWIIGRAPHSATLNGPLGAQSLQSSRSTRRCGPMCKIDWLAWLSRQAVLRFPGRQYPGKVADTDRASIVVGLQRGARSRLPTACGTTSLTMRRCVSATKPSTNRFTCKAVALCAAS
jgi:hypothetical protein